jgi:DNA-binding PadR family transcriptional regulator
MSVRQSLLAILAQGACYGYQLRAELERRSGSGWSVNVGQIYNTLDRLERDGLVVKSAVDPQGHVYYAATQTGIASASGWLLRPLPRASGSRDEIATKIALAATLPGVDAEAAARAERDAAADRLAHARSAATEEHDLARTIAHEARVAGAEAEVRWLERVLERLATTPEASRVQPISQSRPRRGRPARIA